MADPQVTIVVVPRERFSYTERSLTNLYKQTTFPFKLIYVSAGAPQPIQRYLERESQQKGFRLIHISHYLSPVQSRNIGLHEVNTKYVVFLDNDVLVTPGWLEALVRCAEETDAGAVGPLYLIGEFEHATIHMAGGMLYLKEQDGKRVFYDEQYLFDTPIAEAPLPLRRRPCDYVEFHCILVPTRIFEQIGILDEKFLNLHDERDFSLAVSRAGGSIFIEPQAIITYVPPPPGKWWDLPYFMLHWSEAWALSSVRHFNEKWGVVGVRHISDKANVYEEGTVIGFAQMWRRRIAGVRVPGESLTDRPETPLEQAEIMVAMFLSVDRDCFDVTVVTDEGTVVETTPGLDPQGILQRLPHLLQEAEAKNLNVMIHPMSRGRPNDPVLVRLDDLDTEAAAKLRPLAFLILETRPQSYQCWVAINRARWHQTSSLRSLMERNATNGSVHLAGSKNITRAYQQTNGADHRVKLVEGVAGSLINVHQLEDSDVLPYLWSGHFS